MIGLWRVKPPEGFGHSRKDTPTMDANRMPDGLEPASDEDVGRPKSLSEFNGQSAAKENLSVFIDAARRLGRPLDHVLFSGPPGVGKTTLSQIMASELGVGFRTVAAPAIEKPADIVSVLAGMAARDVLFIDEIHRLPAKVEEVLYSAMEDFRLDVIIGEPGQGRPVSIPLEPFTLVGATTRPGNLSAPLRDRFGIPVRLELYTDAEMEMVVRRASLLLSLEMSEEAVSELAKRSRGTPRIGLRLLRRVRDFAVSAGRSTVSAEDADAALLRLGVDREGLDDADRRYVSVLRDRFRGGPVGLSTLASAMGESPDTIEHSLEPFLIRKGIVDRTPRGRMLCGKHAPARMRHGVLQDSLPF